MIEAPFGIYVHWPYCARICPYCDFNIYKSKDQSGDDLVEAIITDLKAWRQASGPREVTSLHFGGGTSSLMRADQIEGIVYAARKLWTFTPDTEIALEANPADANAAKWTLYAEAGINRLSLGVQSFDDAALKFLGRDHDGAQAKKALDIAVLIFPRVSADLIFGHKHQTEMQWMHDLGTAIATGAGHISAYQLTIEAGTAFGRAAGRGDVKAVSNDDSAGLYDLTRETLINAGYAHYEVSNFARPGQESRHNKVYWLGGDYAGAGPGAHGRLTTDKARVATIAPLTPGGYMANPDSLKTAELLSPSEHSAEYILMGLRLSGGISIARYLEISGQDLSPDIITEFCALGLLARNGDTLRATQDGRPVLDTLTRKLLGG